MFKILDGREAFYQWDIDQRLIVADRSIIQVHYCNRTDDCALICECYEHNGNWVADVPNILLQDNWRIRVYAYDGCATKHEQRYDVKPRTKPDTYVYTETEVLNYESIKKQMDAIKNDIEDVVRDYLEENPLNVDLTGYATEVYVDEAIAAIVIPDVAVSLASGKTIESAELLAEMTDIWQNGMSKAVFIDGNQMNTCTIAGSLATGAQIIFYGFRVINEKYNPVAYSVNLRSNGVKVSNGVTSAIAGYATEEFVNSAIEQIELTPGAPGKDGVDGKDGKDGYTPVKGVDYFDGQPGKDGKDGKDGQDGYTPVKGVDYFDGQDGKDGQDGAPGADGKDYVLTEADKQEIAGMVEVTGGGGSGEAVEEVYVGTTTPTDENIKLWVNPEEDAPSADVDLSDYYTKEEIDSLLANLPAGDIPSGEGVKF